MKVAPPAYPVLMMPAFSQAAVCFTQYSSVQIGVRWQDRRHV